jgi:signal transduction histidine kinase
VTNALKHSPGSPVDISVECGRDVMIDVINSMASTEGSQLASVGGGHGLTGIRDRVTVPGGTFSAGPDSPHGWRVSVRFPATDYHAP